MRLPDWVTGWLWRRYGPRRVTKPDVVIGGPEGPYLHRWFIIPRNGLFNLYFHRFFRSDDDRALHDHPWVNVSILIASEYVEVQPTKGATVRRIRREQGSIVMRRPTSAHRVEIDPADSGLVYTLFITGPRVRVWGFWCPQGWRDWREYVDQRDAGQIGKGCA